MLSSSVTTDVEAQFSSNAMSPKPVIIVGQPTSAEKEDTTTKHGTAAPHDLMLRT
jgi:hypothetical protein